MVPQSSAQVSVTPCPTHDIKLDRFEKIWIALLKKYPALARALDKKILDGEGNELTTEAAIEMLISSEEYFPPAPHIRTSTAAELERELTRTSKPATMGSALARVRGFVGHPSNLWHGPGYKPGESPLIVLNSTYE